MIQTFSFKGRELLPFSQARKDVAQALGLHCFQGKPPTLMDMHLIIYVCFCDSKRLAKAFREPDPFIEEAMEWVDKNITHDDYAVETALLRDIMEQTEKARVVPKKDETLAPDPLDLDPNS